VGDNGNKIFGRGKNRVKDVRKFGKNRVPREGTNGKNPRFFSSTLKSA